MMYQKRDVMICVILSIFTLGIYTWYWMYKLNDDVNRLSYEQYPTPSSTVLLLSIATLGIYGIYWCYKTGQQLDRAYQYRGCPPTQKSSMYLILCIFWLSIVSVALIQDEVNRIMDIDAYLASGGQGYTPDANAQQPYANQQYAQQPYANQQYSQQPYANQQYAQQPYANQQYAQQPYANQQSYSGDDD